MGQPVKGTPGSGILIQFFRPIDHQPKKELGMFVKSGKEMPSSPAIALTIRSTQTITLS